MSNTRPPNVETLWEVKDFHDRAQSIVLAFGNLSTLISYAAMLDIDVTDLNNKEDYLKEEFQKVQDEPEENGYKNAYNLKQALKQLREVTEAIRNKVVEMLETY